MSGFYLQLNLQAVAIYLIAFLIPWGATYTFVKLAGADEANIGLALLIPGCYYGYCASVVMRRFMRRELVKAAEREGVRRQDS